jgi:hypothetical protein
MYSTQTEVKRHGGGITPVLVLLVIRVIESRNSNVIRTLQKVLSTERMKACHTLMSCTFHFCFLGMKKEPWHWMQVQNKLDDLGWIWRHALHSAKSRNSLRMWYFNSEQQHYTLRMRNSSATHGRPALIIPRVRSATIGRRADLTYTTRKVSPISETRDTADLARLFNSQPPGGSTVDPAWEARMVE